MRKNNACGTKYYHVSMKKLIILIFIIFSGIIASYGQLADGATVPDFTFTDINGDTQNLYTYLDEGKYVAIDVFTTWCGPCWLYHQTGIMDSLYKLHDNPGDHTWKVLGIEGDATTTIDDLNGIGIDTRGNWLAGTLYPIVNPVGIALNDFVSNFNIFSYPTLMVICPDRRVYADTLNFGDKPGIPRWEYVANKQCGPVEVKNATATSNLLKVSYNPIESNLLITFSVSQIQDISISINNSLGQLISSSHFPKLQPGIRQITVDASTYKSGTYIITISSENNISLRGRIVIL